MILAGTISYWVAMIIAWAFVLTYGVSAPFYRSEEGAHLFSFTAFLAVVLTYIAIVTTISTNTPQYPLPRLLIGWGIAAFMAWRFSLLLRRQVARNTYHQPEE